VRSLQRVETLASNSVEAGGTGEAISDTLALGILSHFPAGDGISIGQLAQQTTALVLSVLRVHCHSLKAACSWLRLPCPSLPISARQLKGRLFPSPSSLSSLPLPSSQARPSSFFYPWAPPAPPSLLFTVAFTIPFLSVCVTHRFHSSFTLPILSLSRRVPGVRSLRRWIHLPLFDFDSLLHHHQNFSIPRTYCYSYPLRASNKRRKHQNVSDQHTDTLRVLLGTLFAPNPTLYTIGSITSPFPIKHRVAHRRRTLSYCNVGSSVIHPSPTLDSTCTSSAVLPISPIPSACPSGLRQFIRGHHPAVAAALSRQRTSDTAVIGLPALKPTNLPLLSTINLSRINFTLCRSHADSPSASSGPMLTSRLHLHHHRHLVAV
jgi:hypothetical protein